MAPKNKLKTTRSSVKRKKEDSLNCQGLQEYPETESSAKRKKENSVKCEYLQENPETNLVLRSANDHEESYLSLLPNEVLLNIYSFLSPVDLSSLSKLDNQRLADLTYTVREANVSSCQRDNPRLVTAFFTRTRMKFIQKLNFNNYCFFKPHELVNLICKCKNLVTLSVIQCGLTYNNIINILQSCPKLEELAWSVEEVVKFHNIPFKKIKRVYLFCDIKEISFKSLYYIIQNFPDAQNVWINFAPDFISALPNIGPWLKSSFVIRTKLSRQFTLISNTFQNVALPSNLLYLSEIINRDRLERIDTSDPVKTRLCINPPYLQLRSTMEDISLLSSGPFNTFSTITIFLTSEIKNVFENLIKCVQEIAGDKLRHLSLQSEAQNYVPREYALPIANEEGLAVCDALERMVLSSKNITVLNLTTVHFGAGSPVKAITELRNLKVLNIPSCAFGTSAKVPEFKSFELADVVSSCPGIEDFALNCCVDDTEEITERDVVCIKDWLRLRHLSIYSLIFRTCNFLQKVADSCVHLQSLSLISVAPNKVCLFTNDVIYVLKKAKNLKFIWINEEKFYPMFERFWPAVGEAVNLEGICIITRSNCHVTKFTIVKEIKKLQFLHLFHFYAPRVPDRLYFEVKKSMQEHGVKNIKVDKCCNIHSWTALSRMLYYHQQPIFCCHLMHLKDINLF